MIWIVIGLIVFIVAVIYIFCDGCWNLFEKFGVSFIMLFPISFITFIILLLGSACTSVVADVEYEMVSDTRIVALKDNQNVGGNFYIMGGYVDEDLHYYYATETELGCKVEKVKSENAYIKYTDDKTHIENMNLSL